MSILNKRFFLSLVAGTLLSSIAIADDPRDVVRDARQHIITSTNGNCVRTQWDINGDACAPKMAAKPHVKRARELAKEERTVYFAFNRSEITPVEQQKLNSLAEVLKSDYEVRGVRIAGYADRIGSQSYNKRLSERRAKNIENYLHKHDYLNTSLAEVRWFGKSEPVTHCPGKLKRPELIACLQKDRRVEVEIDYYPQKSDK